MPLTVSTLQIQIIAALTQTAGLATGTASLSETYTEPLENGTGAQQADKIYSAERTLTASANEDLDLAGSLTDAFGATITFARIKAIFVKALATNSNNVQVTRPASNGVPLFIAAGDGISLRPNAAFAWMCDDATGVVVTAGTGDLLNFANSGGGTSVTYRIIIIGASA